MCTCKRGSEAERASPPPALPAPCPCCASFAVSTHRPDSPENSPLACPSWHPAAIGQVQHVRHMMATRSALGRQRSALAAATAGSCRFTHHAVHAAICHAHSGPSPHTNPPNHSHPAGQIIAGRNHQLLRAQPGGHHARVAGGRLGEHRGLKGRREEGGDSYVLGANSAQRA